MDSIANTAIQELERLGIETRKPSFKSNDEVMCNDAVGSPFETSATEGKDQELRGGPSAAISIPCPCFNSGDFSESHQPCHKTSSKHLERESFSVTIDEDDLMARNHIHMPQIAG